MIPFVRKDSYLPNKKLVPLVIGNGYTTVWDANGLAQYFKETGKIVSFNTTKSSPMLSLVCSISPVQSLNGYDAPWPGGGGSNIWDEQWMLGYYNTNTGAYTSSNSVCSKNFIPVSPSTEYAFVNGGSGYGRVCFYESNAENTFISAVIFTAATKTITTPSNCHYLQFYVSNAYGTTYNNNIAINYPATVTTYAPYSNICPITGHDGVTAFATGANLRGGETLANNIQSNLSSATIDTGAKTVSFAYSAGEAKSPVITGIPFKENTQYTLMLSVLNASTNRSNLQIIYTDGTTAGIPTQKINEKEFVVMSSASGKTVDYIGLLRQGGTTVLYYDECGIFEGVLTADEFEPYVGSTIPVTIPTPPGTVYGGTVDPVSGVLTVDRAEIDMGTLTWTQRGATPQAFYSAVPGIMGKDSQKTVVCSAYASKNDNQNWNTVVGYGDGSICVKIQSTSVLAVVDSSYSDADAFTAGVNGVQAVYLLATPLTYQLTPQAISTLVGQNNVWQESADDVTVETNIYE